MKVLEEDEYISSLSKIIARDFYPLTSETLESKDETLVKDEVSLDEFQQKYTSQDNASFSCIVEKETDERISKIPSLYPQKRLKSSIETWDYKVKNSLIFTPESIHQEAIDSKKSILHANTRFDSLMPPPSAVPLASKDANKNTGVNTVVNSGVRLVENTPVIEPGSLFNPSELLTWGSIESTPVRLDYEIPATPKRDLIAMDLSERSRSKKTKTDKSEAYQRLKSKFKKKN